MLNKAIASQLPKFQSSIKSKVGDGIPGLFSDLGFCILKHFLESEEKESYDDESELRKSAPSEEISEGEEVGWLETDVPETDQ